jgi:hypothetical protein
VNLIYYNTGTMLGGTGSVPESNPRDIKSTCEADNFSRH